MNFNDCGKQVAQEKSHRATLARDLFLLAQLVYRQGHDIAQLRNALKQQENVRTR